MTFHSLGFSIFVMWKDFLCITSKCFSPLYPKKRCLESNMHFCYRGEEKQTKQQSYNNRHLHSHAFLHFHMDKQRHLQLLQFLPTFISDTHSSWKCWYFPRFCSWAWKPWAYCVIQQRKQEDTATAATNSVIIRIITTTWIIIHFIKKLQWNC